jgi:macrolide-specific efflux system membrane fusion protein
LIMKIRKRAIFISAGAAAIVVIVVLAMLRRDPSTGVVSRLVTPHYGTIRVLISSTGTVLPYNRLEIKPEISGRVEQVLVVEGERVRKGQILAWMSSTERAALIDAARSQDPASVKYWEEAYKPIPIVAPITGTIIVRAVEPGQTATNASAILVLSDRLIVKADVDETDIGRVRVGQEVIIGLDAYPDVAVKGRVDQIEYESKVVNNVTTYQVNIVPDRVPEIFRSGMSADISIVEETKKNALLLPNEAVFIENQKDYVWVKSPRGELEKREIRAGVSDDRNLEVLAGVTAKERIAVMVPGSLSLESKPGGSPFMPSRKKPLR